jgi:hypothetical protein
MSQLARDIRQLKANRPKAQTVLPMEKYRNDPIGYAKAIGIDLWDKELVLRLENAVVWCCKDFRHRPLARCRLIGTP